RALVLGLGSGLLPASFAAVTPAAVDCVEASSARLSLFKELPYEAGQSGRAGEPSLAYDDPCTWLLQHPRTYDLIVGQPAVPDRAWIARTNLRLLAGLSQPLDTTSFEARPVNDKENRRLGTELTARSAALTSLLLARAAWLQLSDAPPGSLSDGEREALEHEL